MKILLVQPDFEQKNFGFRLVAMPEPLALEMLAGALPDHDVRIIDLRCGENLVEAVKKFQPDLVGITALTPEVYAALEVAKQVKEISSDIFTVVGGHHASLLPEDFFTPHVDAIVRGDGEPAMAALVEALAHGGDLAELGSVMLRQSSGAFRPPPRMMPPPVLDNLAIPRRDLTAAYRSQYYFLFDRPDTSMATGRGCPYRCNFCSVWEFHDGATHMMSPDRVLKELREIPTSHVTFVDDNFMLNHTRESRIADMIRAEGITKRYSMECRTDAIVRHPELVKKWVDVGLYAMLLGLEGSDKTLAAVGKKNTATVNDRAIRILQDLGVIIWGAFIVDPQWEAEDFDRLQEYVTRHGITHTQFTVLTPLPGTGLYRDMKDKLITDDYTCYDCLHAVLPTRLPREEFYRRFADLYRQRDIQPYVEMVREGKLSIDDLKRGKAMLDQMSRGENYALRDPLLRPGGAMRHQAELAGTHP